MTAIDDRPVTAPSATATDEQVFDAAVRDYIDSHRHTQHATQLSRSARRAGLDAVLSHRERHPRTVIQAGLHATAVRDECDTLQKSGWLLVGLGTHRLSGDIIYVLERAEQDGAP